ATPASSSTATLSLHDALPILVFGDAGAIADSSIATLPHGLWSSVWFASSHDHMAALPNSLLTVTLASNFGTFMLYMLSCIVCMVDRKSTRLNSSHLVISYAVF